MTYYVGNMPVGEDDLLHYGTKGMKWGRRNYQNRDGSLTAAGRMRYGYNKARSWGNRQYRSAKRWANRQVRSGKKYYRNNKDNIRRAARVAGAVAGTAALGYLGYRNRGALKTAGKLLGARASAAGRKLGSGVKSMRARADMKLFPTGSKQQLLRTKTKLKAYETGKKIRNSKQYQGAVNTLSNVRRNARNTGMAIKGHTRSALNVTGESIRNSRLGTSVSGGVSKLKKGYRSARAATHPANRKLRKSQLELYRKTGITNPTLAGLGEKATTRAYKRADRAMANKAKRDAVVQGVKRKADNAKMRAKGTYTSARNVIRENSAARRAARGDVSRQRIMNKVAKRDARQAKQFERVFDNRDKQTAKTLARNSARSRRAQRSELNAIRRSDASRNRIMNKVAKRDARQAKQFERVFNNRDKQTAKTLARNSARSRRKQYAGYAKNTVKRVANNKTVRRTATGLGIAGATYAGYRSNRRRSGKKTRR